MRQRRVSESEADAKSGASSGETKEGGRKKKKKESVIPVPRLKEWFGHERLPDGWWDGVRPSREVGLLEAGKCAKAVGAFKLW